MERFCIDCRDYKGGDVKCSLAISADSKEELLEAAVQHATTVHGYEDTPELREKMFNEFIKEGACTN